MIYSPFNIMFAYFYETSLLLFTLNYSYIPGSIFHSSVNSQILFLSVFPNNLQYFIKHSHHIDDVLDQGKDLWNRVI